MIRKRKHKHKIDFKTSYFYWHYKSRNKEVAFDQKKYTLILTTFFNIVRRKIINEMFRFYFPGIGYFYLIKRKQKSRIKPDGELLVDARVNWPETKKLWKNTTDRTKKVRYLNDHTFGFLYKLYWLKKNNNFTNRSFYSFIPSKEFRQQLSKTLLIADKPLDAYINEEYIRSLNYRP